jgi:hypothetical protein
MLERYAIKTIKWHQNTDSSLEDDEEYIAFLSQYYNLRKDTDAFMGGANSNCFSLHDAIVKDFSSRRIVNDYLIKFKVDAFHYYDCHEIGYKRMVFQLKTKQSMRELSSVEIFDFMIDCNAKQVLFMFHRNHRLTYLIVDYETFTIEQ